MSFAIKLINNWIICCWNECLKATINSIFDMNIFLDDRHKGGEKRET